MGQNGHGMVTRVATPLIQDVQDQLPRRGAGLPRPLEEVQRLVLHHTGAPPVIPLANLAKAHIDSGYAAIAFHYFVRVNGDILQTCNLNEVMSQDRWMLEGIHISLEGNFHEEAPGAKQLTAVAHLCAWLMTELPQAGQWSAQEVVGLCELIPSPSPGQTFMEGPTWRRQIHERITQMLTRDSQPPTPAPRTAATRDRQAQPGQSSAPEPAILDLIAHLPREPHRFYARQPQDVQMVVVNHTGVSGETPLDAIAEGFLAQGVPGILYQYVISTDGAICQTQPLLQVVEPELPYIAQAVNVAFAGQFDNSVPNPAQIQAGGALIAWLLDYFKLPLEAVMGVQELVEHSSPGKQWMSGARWKRSLLDAVAAAIRLGLAPATSRAAQMDARLRQRLEGISQEHAQLQSKLSQIGRQNERLTTDNERLRQEIQNLRREEESLVRVEQPAMEELLERLPRHPELIYERRPLEQITHLAIHHTATPPTVQPERIAQLHVNADPDRGKDPWPGMGYHFFIYPDGRIARTQPLGAIVYHVAHHNASSVGIALAGSFLNGRLPTPEQIRSAAHLVAWLLQELELPLEQVWGHQEFEGNSTVCPGTEWLKGRRWRDELLGLVVALQTGRDR
jgi:N-acetyl-anhydromuramyl-L-alanine amidase AmpD